MSNRVCIGDHATYGHGLYVSKPGKNAQTATNFDLIFNSETTHGSGQIHQIVDITCSSTPPLYEGTGTITGLAYIPFVHIVQYGGSGVKGIASWWGRSAGGGTDDPNGGKKGGGGGGKSQLKWSEWRAKVTNTLITIQSWSGASSGGNYHYTESVNGAAPDLVWPPNTSGDTFRCFVYRIPAAT